MQMESKEDITTRTRELHLKYDFDLGPFVCLVFACCQREASRVQMMLHLYYEVQKSSSF